MKGLHFVLTCERRDSCCVQVSQINPSEEDITRWVYTCRYRILQYCNGWHEDCRLWAKEKLISYLIKDMNNEMWFDPKTGEELDVCPFLRKTRGKNMFKCTIHDTKPQTCRKYTCNPDDMKRIVKRSFRENLKTYRKKRRDESKIRSWSHR